MTKKSALIVSAHSFCCSYALRFISTFNLFYHQTRVGKCQRSNKVVCGGPTNLLSSVKCIKRTSVFMLDLLSVNTPVFAVDSSLILNHHINLS